MRRNIWMEFALLLLCSALLTACGGGNTRLVTGLVTEIQTGEDGGLAAFAVRTDRGEDVGILLTKETQAYPPQNGAWTGDERRSAFQAALQLDAEVSAECARKRTLKTDSGAHLAAYEASYIFITGHLNRGAVTVGDGTPVDVIEDVMFTKRTYQLADGTGLLQVNAPGGPAHSYVGGVEGFDSLSEAAQERVLAYYEKRGLLYDEQEELEKVYALYQKLGADFRPSVVEQRVSPTASSDRVMYFLTTVTLPAGSENGNFVQETRLGDAFDRETGERIDTWDLFSASEEAVVKALLDAIGITDQTLRAEMEAVSWDGRILFFPDGLSVEFERGILPSEPHCGSFFIDYEPAVEALIQDWAMPKSEMG